MNLGEGCVGGGVVNVDGVGLVIISRQTREAVISHARAALPAECCGILLGIKTRVVTVASARNLASDPNRFLIDPKDHIDARREGRRAGLDVVGFYHSHPRSAPVPSETDRLEAAYADHLYLIIGFVDTSAEMRLYRLSNGEFVDVPLDLDEAS